MILHPHAKINLGLRILHRRPDGYHDIESCMLPIGWADQLAVEIATGAAEDSYEIAGLAGELPIERNLIYKAVQLLRAHHRDIPPLRLKLEKRIPSEAGLGGGSADAAYTLLAVNELCHLGLATAQLETLAGELGSDCPFFIQSRPVLVTGRGEKLTPLTMPSALHGKWLLVVKPPIGMSTAEAYRQVIRHPEAEGKLATLLERPIGEWRELIVNDFEPVVFAHYPELAALRDKLYHHGALYAAMSGSGTALYALFTDNPLSSTSLTAHFADLPVWLERLSL
ncbi:4-(cytidine 5'-diphospho)-2-C-methyl-D-erythritol kinase [Porphyromonas uenonis]|uniref:4-diphosphocytidyl-2-C-methyl-D-erythritol kinase n=1 Tax=Porphyromonas uenonis 60-3 TaxID=596327 RepID=C2M9T3_9PORP|nr:4-(cytidine 5'-diphospho)-2-C-methyl-D-erythritol kinase [Porphyromonas uenonis]EEK17522.1 4-(cytidine 5'-diphospho)-2-C-methyl-D-erythritol kinase [Porphyromonas uenonis 60-3]